MAEAVSPRPTIVYMATNRLNGKRYIGVTARGFVRRRREHEKAPNAKRTTCRYFHAAMHKYGAASFDWMILAERATFEAGLAEEIRRISEITPEYNLTIGGQGSTGHRMSEAGRAAWRTKMVGRKMAPEVVARRAASQRGQKRTAETCAKISAGKKGKKFSAEHIKNMAAASTGRKQSAATIAKRVEKLRGKVPTPEHREKIRCALKGRKRPAWIIEKMLAARWPNKEVACTSGL